ncbi:MAG TPA: hypothetical protein VHW90_00100 [Stellaceae bacterium]|jgi:dihydroorotase|nr:hypothetical protein [Stellaceae bacterium]
MTGKDDWSTGTAAASGGVTTVFDMPNTNPPTPSLTRLRAKELAARRAHVDYGFYGVLDRTSLDHIAELREHGVVGFGCFMAGSTGDMSTPDDGIMLEGLERIARLGARCSFHAENAAIIVRRRERLMEIGRRDAHAHRDSRPEICEIEAVSRATLLAEWAGARSHIAHASSADALFLIRDAKARGVPVTAKSCPHYPLLDTDDIAELGGQLHINPPIRRSAGPGMRTRCGVPCATGRSTA